MVNSNRAYKHSQRVTRQFSSQDIHFVRETINSSIPSENLKIQIALLQASSKHQTTHDSNSVVHPKKRLSRNKFVTQLCQWFSQVGKPLLQFKLRYMDVKYLITLYDLIMSILHDLWIKMPIYCSVTSLMKSIHWRLWWFIILKLIDRIQYLMLLLCTDCCGDGLESLTEIHFCWRVQKWSSICPLRLTRIKESQTDWKSNPIATNTVGY